MHAFAMGPTHFLTNYPPTHTQTHTHAMTFFKGSVSLKQTRGKVLVVLFNCHT
ncbi:hypothetical protein PAMP_004400 [Pampus punctatissimus]